MSDNTFGRLFKVTTFGESHGPAIGCVIDGCPPGLEITPEEIKTSMEKFREMMKKRMQAEPNQGGMCGSPPRSHAISISLSAWSRMISRIVDHRSIGVKRNAQRYLMRHVGTLFGRHASRRRNRPLAEAQFEALR